MTAVMALAWLEARRAAARATSLTRGRRPSSGPCPDCSAMSATAARFPEPCIWMLHLHHLLHRLEAG